MAYTAKNAAGQVVKFATVTNTNSDEETVHRVSQSALPAGAATETTLAAVRDRVDQPSTAIYTGSDTSVTTTPAAFASQACREVLYIAHKDNTDSVFLGTSALQVIELPAGESFAMAVANVNVLWRKSASGTQRVDWLARN